MSLGKASREWGHHLVGPADWEYAKDAVYVGLSRNNEWIGLCRAEPDRGYIDGPGFVGPPAGADAAQVIVLRACAQRSSGPVTLETWGDSAEAYVAPGFTVAEECPGWELRLT